MVLLSPVLLREVLTSNKESARGVGCIASPCIPDLNFLRGIFSVVILGSRVDRVLPNF